MNIFSVFTRPRGYWTSPKLVLIEEYKAYMHFHVLVFYIQVFGITLPKDMILMLCAEIVTLNIFSDIHSKLQVSMWIWNVLIYFLIFPSPFHQGALILCCYLHGGLEASWNDSRPLHPKPWKWWICFSSSADFESPWQSWKFLLASVQNEGLIKDI